jgi:hypothetical protein
MYIYGIIAAVVLTVIGGMGFEIHSLKKDNATLTTNVATAVATNAQQKTALQECSAATDKLKADQDKMSADEEAAIAQARLDAITDYKNSNTILFQKPVVPVITKENEADYGGTDKTAQNNDYLATQKLLNDYIDQHNAKKTAAK